MLFFLLYAAVRRTLRLLPGRSGQRSLEIENACSGISSPFSGEAL